MDKIKNTAVAMLTLLSCGWLITAHAETDEMPSGLWQITTKMEMPGMPPEMAAKMSGRVMTHCVKPDEKRKWTEQKNQAERGPQKCEMTDRKVDGNVVTWKMKCDNGAITDGTVTLNGKNAYTMVMNMHSQRGSMKMEMAGKKIADSCEKAAK